MTAAERDARAEAMAEELIEAVVPAVRQYADRLARQGRTLHDVGGSGRVAEIVMRALPRPNRLAERLGPVYTTGQLQHLLPARGRGPITDEAVRARRRAGRLIGVQTAEGRWVYPAYQFRIGSGHLVPRTDVMELWRDLPWRSGRLDSLTLAAWLSGPRRDLAGLTPLEWLDRHGLDAKLRRAAAAVRSRAVS